MAQHFLLSAQARTLSLKAIYQAGDDEAYETFCKLRWPVSNGSPVCPRCEYAKAYHLSTRRRFKCAACHPAAFMTMKAGEVTSPSAFKMR
jgi:hypothetical protein